MLLPTSHACTLPRSFFSSTRGRGSSWGSFVGDCCFSLRLVACVIAPTAEPRRSSSTTTAPASSSRSTTRVRRSSPTPRTAGRSACWRGARSMRTRRSVAPRQVEFKLDYSGGYGKHRTPYWKRFGWVCHPYDGPPLAWCRRLQGPRRLLLGAPGMAAQLPNYGVPPSGRTQPARSCGSPTGPASSPKLEGLQPTGSTNGPLPGGLRHATATRAYTASAGSAPPRVRATPTDKYGRLLYLDTYNSGYGAGWMRKNSFVSHGPPGMFCYLARPPRRQPVGQRQAVPRDRGRPRRDAGRDVVGRRAARRTPQRPRRRPPPRSGRSAIPTASPRIPMSLQRRRGPRSDT